MQCNQTLIRPIHRGPTLNNILPKLNNLQHVSIINANLGYHNLKLDKQSSYLTTFACPFGIYHSEQPWQATCFNIKLMKFLNNMPNVFGIADDILLIGYAKDGMDHDKAVYNLLRQCQDVNLKLNKDKCHFRCMLIPFFGEVVSREGIQLDLRKIRALTKMPVPKNKKELEAFLGIINYLRKFSPRYIGGMQTT